MFPPFAHHIIFTSLSANIAFISSAFSFAVALYPFVFENKFFENSLEKIIPDNIEIELKTPNNTVAISEQYQNKIDTKKIWQIEIPKINLVAPIAEGTSANIMNEYVGHFEETPKNKGNIGLAAHNRGYKINYFQNLKLLQKGDLIIYTYNGEISKYSVNELGIIKDIDWSKLESSSQDKLTLITCLEDEPEYRRYIQAVKL